MTTAASLPIELLLLIFSFACTDGGQAGCALDLVCRTFRDVCLDTGVDIQSALVHGEPGKMEAFLDMLRKRPATKRKVRFLFLTHRSYQTDARVRTFFGR